MRRTRLSLILSLVLLAGPAAAQDNGLAWPLSDRHTAAVVSDWLVAGQLGAAVVSGLRSADRKQALSCLSYRVGVTVGVAELVKRTVHRTRPDESDRMSFYSEHTALATVASGWRFQVSVPIAIGAGYLRVAANKHFPSDVAVGALAGYLARKVCP